MTAYSDTDLIRAALDALDASGLAPHDASKDLPRFDGQLRRFRVEGDKAGSNNGWMVFYGDGVPSGAFGSWKTGQSETWCAKGESDLSSAEKLQRDQHLAAARAARLALETQVHDHARTRAADLWSKSRETVDANHGYLVNKQIPAIGIRQLQATLVVPLQDPSGTLHSLQFINPDGGKRFLTGGAISGHYAVIGTLPGAETILIAEGYATAISVHRASGLPVVVAFNAGNLLPVGEALHRQFARARLIFCGDDDQWTDGNPGRSKANTAAATVGGFAVFPDFGPLSEGERPTDWNDLHCRVGLPALKAQLLRALESCTPDSARRQRLEQLIDATDDFETLVTVLPRQIADSRLPKPTVSYLLKRIAAKVKVPINDLREQTRPVAEDLKGWKARLKYDESGNLRPTLANIVTILSESPEWRGALVLDEFSMDVLKRRKLPFACADGPWLDIDSSKTRIWLETEYDLTPNTLLVDEAIQVVAEGHPVHVVREHLEGLDWDGRPRLKTWPLRYLGAVDGPANRFIGQAWMVGAVKRVYEPGCKFDNVLTLEGPQGAGKSTVLAILGGAWHAESVTDVGSKDSLMVLRGKWILEFAELDALGRVESSRIKQHISAPCDTYRPPYGRRTITVPRQGVFAATCNPQQYLKDETGGRRFWPIRCGAIDIEALRRDRDQLWAEALALYRQGEQTWATADMAYLSQAQEDRYQTDPWEELIAEKVMMVKELQVREVMEMLYIDSAHQTQSEKNRIVKALTRLGFRLQITRRNNLSVRLYVRD